MILSIDLIPTYFDLKVLIAELVPMESQKKKKNLDSILSLQWLCKIPFSEPTYLELKVLIAELVPLESQKKIC